MADIFLNSVDGNDADDGSTWALAKLTIATGIAGIDTTDQRIVIDSSHAETAASITYTCPGTPAAPNQLLSVTQTGASGISALTAGATFTANSGSTGLTFNGSYYGYGLKFIVSTTSSTGLNIGGASGNVVTLDTCDLHYTGSGASGSIALGAGVSGGGGKVTLNNCNFKFGATGQRVSYVSEVEINGGAWAGTGTLNPTAIFTPLTGGGRGSKLTVSGFDFSSLNAAINLIGTGQGGSTAVFRNCKLPSSWTGAPIADASLVSGQRVEVHNCDSGDTNYVLWVKCYEGSINHNTAIRNDAGATDGTTRLSWKMSSTANVKYPCSGLISPEIVKWNETTGSAITVTVEFVHDTNVAAGQGAGTSSRFRDDEVWLEIQYLGTSGVPLSLFADDAAATVITTAADQTDSSVTWTTTGLTTPQKQKMSVPFTPQEKGFIIARVVLAAASKTIYVDPLLTVS